MIRGTIPSRMLLGAAAVAALLFAASAQAAASCPAKAERVDVTVSNDKITSPPAGSKVTIYEDETTGKSKACWMITGLYKGYTLKFIMKDGVPSTASLDFDDGKTVRGKRSGKARRVGVPDKSGSWHYKIELKEGDLVKDTLDPEVQIIGPGAGGGG